MRVGAICSAGGSAFFSAVELAMECDLLSPADVVVVTDRACEAIGKSEEMGIACHRIDWSGNAQFSEAARDVLGRAGCDVTLLFFTRLITSELFSSILCFNIHPSLLPAYSGFHALDRARARNAGFVGATLHVTNANPDDGLIVAQVASPIDASATADSWSRVSYVQKTYLAFCLLEWMHSGAVSVSPGSEAVNWIASRRTTPSCSPALRAEASIAAFDRFQGQLGTRALIP
ncbi:formyltransferase family protein [Nitrobacter sp. JJSN]|uniref:formyltransferase family protein n=1 Tax=Nitrobacter sp. JJSN TaxID=3453033 RepID=UPI003F7591B6